MNKLLFATGNNEKFKIAQAFCGPRGIELEMFDTESDEIQAEDPKKIILHKLEEKYRLSDKRPVVVSDDNWDIPGLNGFPGPYMKSVDEWFTPQNMIDLMQHVKNRTIILHQYLAYKDTSQVKIFHTPEYGIILSEPKGNYGKPMQKVISLEADKGLSIAQVYDAGDEHNPARLNEKNIVWYKFIDWYKTNS